MASSIDGIISGLDTTAIVEAIINAQRFQVNHLMQRQAEATNQVTTYNSISALVVALQTSISPLLKPSAFTAATLSVSDTTAFSATATGTVAPGAHSITVESLATNNQLASQGFDDPTDSLGTGTIEISVGSGSSTTITLDSTNNTLTGLKNAINEAGIGVTASIINDGSAGNSYRLMLTAKESGSANSINLTTSLTGTEPNFKTSSFDAVEQSPFATGTSVIALGSGASYSASENKTYSFTVAGSGEQTVGSGTITINWTDGTNSGSIEVDDVDTEVTLTGTGADGLTVTFGAGTLVAGDKFDVQTFSPLIQAATDARISLGSTAGGGSPITITSSSNTIKDLITGVTLELKSVTTSAVTVTAAIDKDGITSKIRGMLDKYSKVMTAIDKQFSYNSETKTAGILLGDAFLLALQRGLRAPLSGALDDQSLSLKTLRSIGIHTIDNGTMGLAGSSLLSDKLESDLGGVIALFTDSGSSTNSLVTFVGAGTNAVETKDGYDINISQTASRAELKTAEISDPSSAPLTILSSANSFKLTINGVESDTLTLGAKTYSTGAALAAEVQTKIAADKFIGGRGVIVEWIDLGDTGYLSLTSGSYGSSGSVVALASESNSALSVLGLGNGGTHVAGEDVVGTINGESATGSGRLLTGNSGNATTAGFSVQVDLTQSDLVSGVESKVTFNRGFASRLQRASDSIARSIDGSIARRTKGIQNEIKDLQEQIDVQEARLAVRRDKLFQRFVELEVLLGQFQTQSTFLNQQLSQISANSRSMFTRS